MSGRKDPLAGLILGHGPDSLGGFGRGVFGVSKWCGWVEERAAQVLELAQPCGGHGEPAPAPRAAVEHGPDQGQAASFAG